MKLFKLSDKLSKWTSSQSQLSYSIHVFTYSFTIIKTFAQVLDVFKRILSHNLTHVFSGYDMQDKSKERQYTYILFITSIIS